MAGLFIGFLVEKCSILKLVYFDSWSWQSFLSTCDVFNCLFPLDVQNEIQLPSGVFPSSWLVSLLLFDWEIRRNFGWHRFRFHLAWFVMHQSIPPVPSPLPGWPRALAFFCLGRRILGGGDSWAVKSPGMGTEKRGQMPRPPSTLQHFLLLAQSISAILAELRARSAPAAHHG